VMQHVAKIQLFVELSLQAILLTSIKKTWTNNRFCCYESIN